MNNPSSGQPEGFEFRGSAREWFGIWIVNLLLSIVTIGIYSAWAKVRTKKYFYQNTFVAGRNFDYHATGMQILIGRIIMIAAFAVFSVVSAIPLIGLVAVLALFAALPWLLVRSLCFNAQMSSWSNVRFRFSGGYMGAFLAYVIYPFLTFLTAYLAFPFLDRAMKRYTMNNHSLGGHTFTFDANIGPFYKAFFAALAWVIGVTLVIGALIFPGLAAFDPIALEEDPAALAGVVAGFYAWLFIAFLPAATIYRALVRNVTLQNLSLEGGHQFYSNVSAGKLIWITMSNALITVVSLGFMLPWAQVRMTRYMADHTALIPGGSLDGFVGKLEAEATALGDAYTDLEGIEVGLPV